MSVENPMKAQAQDQRILALRESIRRSFPDEFYKGTITGDDDKLDDPEFGEEKDLFAAMKGHKWSEVPIQLLLNQSSGYELLTDEAYRVFLAAWLMYALEGMDTENEVRNFLAYSFGNTMRRFRVLSEEQQLTVRSLLMEFSERGLSPFVRKHAIQAITYIDRKHY